MRERSRALAFSMLLLTFIVGALAGMVIEEGLGLDWFDFLDEDRAGEVVSGDERFLLQMDLTTSQREQVTRIFARQDEQLEEYWRRHLPAIRAIVAETDAQIGAALTPAQRAVYQERIRSRGGDMPKPGAD